MNDLAAAFAWAIGGVLAIVGVVWFMVACLGGPVSHKGNSDVIIVPGPRGTVMVIPVPRDEDTTSVHVDSLSQ